MKLTAPKGKLLNHPLSAIRYPCSRRVRWSCWVALRKATHSTPARKVSHCRDTNAAVHRPQEPVKEEPGNAKAQAHCWPTRWCRRRDSRPYIEVQKAKELGAPATRCCWRTARLDGGPQRVHAALEKCKPDGAPDSAQADLQISYGRALLGLERAAGREAAVRSRAGRQTEQPRRAARLARATTPIEGLPAPRRVWTRPSADIQKAPVLDGNGRPSTRRRVIARLSRLTRSARERRQERWRTADGLGAWPSRRSPGKVKEANGDGRAA